ncbi:MAG: hypothetical protein ACI35W_05250 [Anaeroplasmataceae bacterium]
MDINIKDIIKFNNDTNTINYAIEKCSEEGGGRVIIPSGLYLCNTIRLRSNVCLYLSEGAIIKLSSNLDEFYDIKVNRNTSIDAPTWENCEYDGKPSKYFIYAYNETNISIEGMGIIDGNEEIFYGNVTPYHIEGAFYPRIPFNKTYKTL